MTSYTFNADYMREWAKHTHGSPLYAHLSEVIAESDELMRIINRIPQNTAPNVLFAAVQFLLMEEPNQPLAGYYPSLTRTALPLEGVGPVFTEFVVANEDAIAAIGETRYTQTNECRRCVALVPAIWRSGLERFHLVDLGASAGLNLAIDRYHYVWDEVEWGPDSDVVLRCEMRGGEPEPRPIEIVTRTGLDLNPIDISDPAERRWLASLIWPEHHERRSRLEAALAIAGPVEMSMVAGSALDTLGPALADLPSGEAVVVMNSFTLNQFSGEQKDRIADIVDDARAERMVYRVSYEYMGQDAEWPALTIDDGSGMTHIGQAHPHGEWLELFQTL